MGTTLEQLVARADGRQFALTVVATGNQVTGNDPLQRQFPPRPGEPRVLVTWNAVYRAKRIGSERFGPFAGLVVPASFSAFAQQLVLDAAWYTMDDVDARMGTTGRPPDGLVGQPGYSSKIIGGVVK